MDSAREIEIAIDRLAPGEQERLAAWFEKRIQERWDKQLEEDAASGRLDQAFDMLVEEEGPGGESPLDDLLDDSKLS